jgi:hypothetical protein
VRKRILETKPGVTTRSITAVLEVVSWAMSWSTRLKFFSGTLLIGFTAVTSGHISPLKNPVQPLEKLPLDLGAPALNVDWAATECRRAVQMG